MAEIASRAALPGKAPAPKPSWWLHYRMQASTITMLVLLYVAFIAVAPEVYLSYDIYRSFMISIPFFGIMALAMTFVVTLGEIDLSFPSICGIAGWGFSEVYIDTGSFALALAVCLLIGIATGLFNGFLVARVRIPSIVATIGTMFLWRGLVNVLTEGKGLPMPQITSDPLNALFVGQLFGEIPAQFLWFLAFAIVLGLLYKRHRFGSHVLFVGDNPDSALMMGINVARVTILCYVLVGFVAALSVVLLLNQMMFFWSSTGDGYLLTTLAAVFIGGTSVFGGRGTMVGTFVGVLIIASLEPGIIALGLTGFWTQFIYGLLITISVTVYALMQRRRV